MSKVIALKSLTDHSGYSFSIVSTLLCSLVKAYLYIWALGGKIL